jgi:hypothetical protein
VIVAAHDAEIAVLAATDDGSIAVSADRHGGMRLWPNLDGSREPVVVPGDVTAEQLAIVRDGDDVVIAAAGPLGQLSLIRTTAGGQLISHVRVDLERTIVSLHATSGGFVGLRDDQMAVGVDRHGERIGTLAANPGERIVAMASRRGRLLAFVTAEGRTWGRWIEADKQLAWGSESPPLPIDAAQAVLAPDHERVAALARNHEAIVIVSLRDGRTLERPLTAERVIFPARPLGFLDERTVAVSSSTESGWWRRGAWTDSTLGQPAGPTVATDRHLITAEFANLALDTPGGTRYLGFRLLNITSAVRRGSGWMITDGRAVLGVDGQLRARKRYRVVDPGAARPEDLVLLDDRHCVMRFVTQVYQVDLDHPDDRALLTSIPGPIHHEPATHLLLIGDEGTRWLGRYDPKAGEFRETRELHGQHGQGRPGWIELRDPAANQGNVAWELVEDGSAVTVIAIRAIDFAADDPLREGRSYTRQAPDALLLARGRSLGSMPLPARPPEGPGVVADAIAARFPAAARHHTSPDGALVAIVGGGRITLRDRKGDVRWAVALPGVVDVHWGGPDQLVAFGSGMATLDVATGALLDRRCGWEFGLWDAHDAQFDRGARLCEAP